jgi:hypothetical protein
MKESCNLTQGWSNPGREFRSAPFWSWNSKLDADRLCRAIDSMHSAGMGGFFMHSRYGLKTPYLSEEWFECVSACVERARSLGMKAYLYDEDRWPSGAAGGIVTRKNPEYGMVFLRCTTSAEPAKNAERLATFDVALDGSGRMVSYREADASAAATPGDVRVSFDVVPTPTSPWYNDGQYLDTMSHDAVAEFIHVTHQAYADRYGEDFGGVIPAIFSDEPNYGSASTDAATGDHKMVWTGQMPREFVKRRGYDLRQCLPELVFPSAGSEFSKVRHDYFRTATELFVESFSRQVGRWCGKHRIALTGHMLCEETLKRQINYVGACMPHYEHMQWPGIDILCDQDEELITAKQCSSVADQLGRQRVLSELYGVTGWDWPLEGHKFVGDWQYAVGVNFRCPHLTHFSLAGGAKRDYPASIFSHSPWWPYYGVVEDYFGRLSLALTQGKPVRDVLVIHNVESGWGACFRAGKQELLTELDDGLAKLTRTLSNQHYDWDFADESLLASHGQVNTKGIKVGRLTYKLAIVGPSVTLRKTTIDLLAELLAKGGSVLFVGRQPNLVDSEPGEAIGKLVAAGRCCDNADAAIAAVESVLARRVSITQDGRQQTCVWSMLRKLDQGQLLFVQSHDRAAGHRLNLDVAGHEPVVLWDAQTGERTRVEASVAGKGGGARVSFDLDLPPTGSALLTLGMDVPEAVEPAPAPVVTAKTALAGPFEIQPTEPNTMPLDYCRYSFGDEPFSQDMPVLKADAEIRARFGLGSRLGGGHQPWYLYAAGTVDTAPRGRCRLKFGFHVTDLPAQCKLALERPEDFTITVNGRPAGKPDGFWVDEDIRTVDITGLLVAGGNEVLLTMDYRPDMELEDLYLVGEFGVRLHQGEVPAPGAMTIVAPPTRLVLGSWIGQGLTFYGGAVLYRMVVRKSPGRRIRLRLPGVQATAVVVRAGDKAMVLPWAPMEVELTDALADGDNAVTLEVIGGRKNILGPMHVPWQKWTGPGQFDPNNKDWTHHYQLVDHGLTEAVIVEEIR